MPDAQTLSRMFDALVRNGINFLERSTEELTNAQTFSIAHFATGIELVLKARWFHEHWSLVSAQPHDTAWTAIKDGSVPSIAAGNLVPALEKITGTPLKTEQAVFKEIFAH